MFAHIIWPGTCFAPFSLLLSLYSVDAVPYSFCEGEAGLREVFTFALNHAENSWLAYWKELDDLRKSWYTNFQLES